MEQAEIPRAEPALTQTIEGPAADLDQYDILLLDAATKQSLASARSLGRAGLRVALAECFAECDPVQPVVGFRSRYSARNVVLPSYADDAAAFAVAVIEFVRDHSTRVVLPVMDGSIAALAPVRDQLAALGCRLALPSDDVLEVANDKDRTLAVARDLGLEQPMTRRIDNLDEAPEVLAEFDFPIVLKPTISWSADSAVRLQPVEVVDEVEAVAAIRAYLATGVGVLVQQWASGRREGVTMFIVDGDILACCGHVAHRTSPALGGASVMRESVPVAPEIYAAAVNLVKAIELQGVCEVEFRRDAHGRPLLMEINARLAGTIENAMHSGVDFPLMIWQWATEQPVTRVDSYEIGVRTRWLRGDLRWLRDNQRRVGRPDSVSRTRALWIFGTEFIKTRHHDCLDRHDLGPSLAEVRNTVGVVWQSLRAKPPAQTWIKGA